MLYRFLSWIKRKGILYRRIRKEHFKSKCIEGASKACYGKLRIYYFVLDIGENKLQGKCEANCLSDNKKHFLVVDWRNIEGSGMSMLNVDGSC